MNNVFPLSYFWSKSFLTSAWMLWMLFWVNLLGTIYGYQWYWDQMHETIIDKKLWLVLFVPDSPTASLFFTLGLIYLLMDLKRKKAGKQDLPKTSPPFRGIIEALGLIASFKYGVWAVGIIFASASKGESMGFEDWMLAVSHSGMVVEALLFARVFRMNFLGLAVAGCWVFGNDYIDYQFAVFPWLSDQLYGILETIRRATILLSLCSWLVFCGFYLVRLKQKV